MITICWSRFIELLVDLVRAIVASPQRAAAFVVPVSLFVRFVVWRFAKERRAS